MTEKRFSLVKPTLKSKFFIDFEWWQKHDRDWHVYLRTLLCPQHQETLSELPEGEMLDWVDPETAEVHLVDGLQHVLMTHCARQEDFITPHTATVDAVFRLLLANGNVPMPITEIADRLNKPVRTLLRTFSSPRVYRGIRPCEEC